MNNLYYEPEPTEEISKNKSISKKKINKAIFKTNKEIHKTTNDKLIIKKSKQISRPTFYFNQDDKQEIRAGGGIFYKIDKDTQQISLLMIKTRGKYEDFGGKTDNIDANINETIAREVDEESNGLLKKKGVLKRICNCVPLYSGSSKYMLYIIELTGEEIKLKPEDFGDMEFHDNIARTVEFIPIEKFKDKKFIKDELCFRLKFRAFFQYINDLSSISS